jgi:hypothetical protein
VQRKERTQSRARKIGTARAQERERERESAKALVRLSTDVLEKKQVHRFDFPCVLRIISRLSLSSHELPIQAHGSQSSGSEQGNVEP